MPVTKKYSINFDEVIITMPLMPFLLGLIIGLGICFWKQYQFNRQLKEILTSFSQEEQVKSLSAISLIRRTVKIFQRQYDNLQRELELYIYLLDNASIGCLRIDQQNQLIWCNKQARELLKIKNWPPQNPRLFLEFVRCYELDQLIQQTRKTQQNLSIEWQFYPGNTCLLKPQDNSQNNNKNYPIFLKAYGYPLEEDAVGILIENKQELMNLSEKRDRAFCDLSHELRTPLTSMSLLAEALLSRTENQEKEWIKQMSKEINRLIDLVQNWLDIARINENPTQNLHYQILDLKQLIISAWQSLELLAQEKELIFNCNGNENIDIEADLNLLIQVFVNLFHNAIKHSYERGIIEVNFILISQEFDLIEINIIDSGTGFNEADLPYVFERLYRGDKSRVRNSQQGSGLGLAIVKEIISAHNGSIIAQNHPETGGAWFKITLPQIVVS